MKKLIPAMLIFALLFTGCGILAPAQTVAPAEEAGEPFVFSAESFPVLAVGSALRPLAEGAASLLLGGDAATADIRDGATDEAYRALMDGEAAVVLASSPSEAMVREMAERGFTYDAAPIALDALVFLVSEDNPVDGLTTQQLRDIYSGKITNWKQLGGRSEEITAFQRSAASGSQTAMEELVMNGTAMADAPSRQVLDNMAGPTRVLDSFDGSSGAIGYTFLYYAQTMGVGEGMKILAVDGVTPGSDTVTSDAYPFLVTYCAAVATDAAEESPERVLWDWIQAANGRKLLLGCGYVPLR